MCSCATPHFDQKTKLVRLEGERRVGGLGNYIEVYLLENRKWLNVAIFG